MGNKKTILAIETSCDETGIALVEASGGFASPKFSVLKNLVSSQIKIHRPFGGVVPGLAKREHIKNLPPLYRQIFGKEQRAKSKSFKADKRLAISNKPDIIAVTVGPGLEPALWTGIEFAKQIQSRMNAERTRINAEKIQRRPELNRRRSATELIGVNHIEGHVYSFLLSKNLYRRSPVAGRRSRIFPAVVLTVSGGHTALLLMKNLRKWKKLGETRDDAAGEAFDKVARMLGLPYPGGPEIEKLAKKGDADAINFPRPMLNQKNYDFSFSGIKTAVFYYLRDRGPETSNKLKTDVAASFQKAVVETLVKKSERAAKEYGARSLILCGGVAANRKLRRDMRQATKKLGIKFFVPEMEYNNDNAAMIAAAGYFAYLKGKKSAKGAAPAVGQGSASDGLPLKANGALNI